MKVRTRIAPSPTGSPHVGTAYQALFNHAFANKHHGDFLVRIEDTDQSRKVEGAEEEIFSALDWLGLYPCESPYHGGKYGPYRQSERLDLYQKYAQQLVETNRAYYCFCSEERLETVRKEQQEKGLAPRYDKYCRVLSKEEAAARLSRGEKAVIRLKVPETGITVVEDPLRGKVEFKNSEIDDQVLLKSDHFPTYHLAIVVDDHYMQITHPVRGEEWLPSYPKHKIIYEALGWEMPLYYHTPIIRGSKKEKLGKRFGHSSLNFYKKEGYLPEALLNYLALLGWSHPEGKEFFTLAEFTEKFDLKDLSTVGPIFDLAKLTWLNNQWMQHLPAEEVYKHLGEYLAANGWQEISAQEFASKNPLILKLIDLAKPRMETFKDFYTLSKGLFLNEAAFIEHRKSFLNKLTLSSEEIKRVKECLKSLNNWSEPQIKETLQNLYDKEFSDGLTKRDFFVSLYVLLTGAPVGLPLFDVMEILGKDTSLSRL